MRLRAVVVTTHRWLGVIAAALWLVQAATGIFAVFHWEIDDAITAGAHRATDFKAIERGISRFSPHSVWSTAGAADRYDVYAEGRVFRVDGAGNVLRIRLEDERVAHGGFVETLVVLHQSLLAGTRGRWITGTSGLLLLSNLILGLIAAWARRGQWKRALTPSTSGSRLAVLYSWHRALGLWLAIPALCVVTAGVLLAFDESLERLLHPAPAEPPMQRPTSPLRIGMAEAVASALARYPGAEVSGIEFPSPGDTLWSITLKQPGELQRAYGKTRVFVRIDGPIVADFNALTAEPKRRFLNVLFAFHTGEVGGIAGRIAVLVVGTWLLAMITLGIALWWTRRSKSSVPSPAVAREGTRFYRASTEN
jgi:uncharacterized iron-regulated membrane protein